MAVPSLQEIRAWVDVAEGTLDDDQLQRIVSAETLSQSKRCRVPLMSADYPDDLAQALMRRVARAVAVKGIPLGVVANSGQGTQGTSSVAEVDREISRYEGPYRRLTAG